METQKGQVTILQLIAYGASIAMTIGGIMWAKVTANDNELGATKERVATIEEAVRTLKSTADETRSDVKLILQKISK